MYRTLNVNLSLKVSCTRAARQSYMEEMKRASLVRTISVTLQAVALWRAFVMVVAQTAGPLGKDTDVVRLLRVSINL